MKKKKPFKNEKKNGSKPRFLIPTSVYSSNRFNFLPSLSNLSIDLCILLVSELDVVQII